MDRMKEHLKAYASEFVGTAILMIAGIAAISFNFGEQSQLANLLPNETLRLALAGAGFALGANIVIYSALGQTSGGHLNPAITIAFWMQGKIETKQLAPYMFCQCLGALAGTWFVATLIPDLSSSVGHGVTSIADTITPGVAILLEALLTMAFVLMIFWMTSCHDRARYTGLCVFIYLVIVVPLEAPLTGTSINPARSIGPAIYANNYTDLVIYIIAPMTGAIAGTLIARYVLNQRPKCKRVCGLPKKKL
jgi:aquaporin Z